MEVVACVTLAAVAMLGVSAVRRAAFNRQFPPLSDAGFLARCRPGVDPAVALKVRRMVADYFAIEYERVHPELAFLDLDG